jgi:hypothetical protein
MNLRTKKLLAGAVLATLGSGAVAADKVPTLGDVLKASGIEFSGYIDASYTYLSTDKGSNSYHAYTNEPSGNFNLHALDFTVSSLPASGFGGLAELTLGKDADFNASKGTSNTDNVDLLQAYIQYAAGSFALLAGKFTTLAGAEVPQAPNNSNFSRSLLYTNAIPVSHTGLRGTYALSDSYKFIVGLNNGWDNMKESDSANCNAAGTTCARGKTAELGVNMTPVKPLNLVLSYYGGDEMSSTSDFIGKRQLVDFVATYNITDALSLVLNYDKGDQKKAAVDTGGSVVTAKWDGLAGYVNYKFSDSWRLSARGEKFNDKNCFKIACSLGSGSSATTPTSVDVKEATLTVGYAPAKNTELRAELRQDKASAQVYTENQKATDKQTFYGIEAVYKF